MNNKKQSILIDAFDYNLPEESIAKYPLEDRASCKLLRYSPLEDSISDHFFSELPDLLPPESLLVVNNSRVIKARLFMERASGAIIEIFCLSPIAPSSFDRALAVNSTTTWNCLVGNSRKWKEDSLEKKLTMPDGGHVTLKATRNKERPFDITFTIDNPLYTFGQVLEAFGSLPIPPYLHRETEESDLKNYQTVYAVCEGSVAAPTAGLHFTDELFESIKKKRIIKNEVTLHVGAGTFLPVKSKDVCEHEMHSEVCSVSIQTLENLITFHGRTTAVGTTSVRTLESLFFLACNHLDEIGIDDQIPHIDQWEPYGDTSDYNTTEVFSRLLHRMDNLDLDSVTFTTSLLIVPGFNFHITNALITNFHQPKSTLLLMISAFVGDDWQRLYRHALDNRYRFLSYGDACLLYPKQN